MAVPGVSLDSRVSVGGPSPGKSPRRPIAVNIPMPPERHSAINIVTNPSFDSRNDAADQPEEALYSTIQPKHECGSSPSSPPPPLPPKQVEALYTRPVKSKKGKHSGLRNSKEISDGPQMWKLHTSQETPETKAVQNGPGCNCQQLASLLQDNYAMKHELLTYKDRIKSLTSKLKQYEGISDVMKELQLSVEKVSEENAKLKQYEKCAVDVKAIEQERRDLYEQLKDAQSQYKYDVDHLSQQVSQLEKEKQELELSLAKLQQEHDRLLINTQNSVSFEFHTTAMLEVKRLLEELKQKYQNDKENLGLKVQAHQVVSERDSLEIKNEEKEKECQRMMELLSRHNIDFDQLNKYLKNMHDQTEEEKYKAKLRREAGSNLQEEYEQQVAHLHGKVEQKQEELEKVQGEKRRLERELEQLWQVLTHEADVKALGGETAFSVLSCTN